MTDFFSNLAKTLQTPQMQSAMMSMSGTPFEVQAPILQQQAQMQQMQQAEEAKAMLENLLSDGDLSDEKILQVYMLSPELGNALVKMREMQNPQPKLQFNPVTGDMYDMRTGLPYSPMAQTGASMEDSAYNTVFEAPASDISGLSPRGRIEAEKSMIEANAPLTKAEQERINLENRRVAAMEQKNLREQEKAEQEKKEIKNQNQTLLNFLEKKEAAIDRLLSPKSGLTSAVGFIQSRLPTVFESTREAEKDLEQIRGLETLDAAGMNILKGVLSDTDMALLKAASTGALDLQRGDATVINELARIKGEIAVARQRLGGATNSNASSSQTKRLKYNPVTGDFE